MVQVLWLSQVVSSVGWCQSRRATARSSKSSVGSCSTRSCSGCHALSKRRSNSVVTSWIWPALRPSAWPCSVPSSRPSSRPSWRACWVYCRAKGALPAPCGPARGALPWGCPNGPYPVSRSSPPGRRFRGGLGRRAMAPPGPRAESRRSTATPKAEPDAPVRATVMRFAGRAMVLSLIHISEPTRPS